MHDNDEILVPYTFKNGESPAQNVVVPDDRLVYELFLQPGGGAPAVKVVTSGVGATYDLTPATPAELAAEFPINTPTNGVWVSGKNLTSPIGNYFVNVIATQPGVPQLTKVNSPFLVSRDPSLAVTVAPSPLGAPRPRTH